MVLGLCLLLCLHLCVPWSHSTGLWFLENRILTAHPGSYKQRVQAVLRMHARLPTRDLGVGRWVAELIEINWNLLLKPSPGSLKPWVNFWVPKHIRQILPEKLLSRWRERFLVLPTPLSLQNPFPAVVGIWYFIRSLNFYNIRKQLFKNLVWQSQELRGNYFWFLLFVYFIPRRIKSGKNYLLSFKRYT